MERFFSQAMKSQAGSGWNEGGEGFTIYTCINHQVVYLRLTQCCMSVFYILYFSIAGGIKGEAVPVSRWALRVGHRGEGLRNGLSNPWQPGREPVPGLAEAMFWKVESG